MKKFIYIIVIAASLVCAASAFAAWSPREDEYWIKVNKQRLDLTLLKGEEPVKKWPVSIGRGKGTVKTSREDLITPTGTFTIYRVDHNAMERIYDPAWFDEEGEPQKGVYGTKLISFYNKWQIAIHGTNNPRSVGRRATHGCVRLRNRDIEELVTYVTPKMKLVITEGDPDRKFYRETI